MVTILRVVAIEQGKVLAAAWSGKVKTTVQLLGVILIILTDILFLSGAYIPVRLITLILGWLMAIVTLYSGYDYMTKNKDVLLSGLFSKKD